MHHTHQAEWRPAVMWGLKIALAHRLLLLVWMAFVWLAVGQPQNIPVDLHVDPIAELPELSAAEKATVGVWRRWDASHYLNLAQNGYRTDDPGPTVFGILTPASIRVFDIISPGGLDVGGMMFATAAFALALTLLHRVCEVYFHDQDLARRTTFILAILPHSFFLSAPMSEAIYLALVLGVFYAGAKTKWGWAAVFGALATLARHQGALMAGVLILLMIEHSQKVYPTWRERIGYTARHGWVTVLIVGAFGGFILFRQSLGLPSLTDAFLTYSYIYTTDPISGIAANARFLVEHPVNALVNADLWAMALSTALVIVLCRDPHHRRLSLVAYTVGYMLVFVSKINYVWGGYDETMNTQSFARYALALFPLWILVADRLRRLPPRTQAAFTALSITGLLIFSALFTLGGGSP